MCSRRRASNSSKTHLVKWHPDSVHLLFDFPPVALPLHAPANGCLSATWLASAALAAHRNYDDDIIRQRVHTHRRFCCNVVIPCDVCECRQWESISAQYWSNLISFFTLLLAPRSPRRAARCLSQNTKHQIQMKTWKICGRAVRVQLWWTVC